MTITTAGSGNWTSTTNNAPWPGGTVPTAADAVIIANTHTVTLDATSPVALSLTVNNGGTLTCTGSASVTLTIQGALTQATGSNITLDMTSDVTKICTIILNNVRGAAATNGYWYSTGTATTVLKGFVKTRWTTLSSAVTATDTTCSVTAATGWQTGDKLVFGTTQAYNATPRVDLSTGTNTVSGTSISNITAFTYNHASAGLVGNFSSNLVIKGNTAGDAVAVILEQNGSTRIGTRTITDVEFNGLNSVSSFPGSGLQLRASFAGADGTGLTTPYTRIGNNAFYDCRSHSLALGNLNTPIPRDNNIFYAPSCSASSHCIQGSSNTYVGDDTSSIVFRSAGGGINGNGCPGSVFTTAQVSGITGAFSSTSTIAAMTAGLEVSYVNCDSYSNVAPIGIFAGSSSFSSSRIGTQFAGAATNSVVNNFSGIGKCTITDSYIQATGTLNTGLSTATPGAVLNLVNRSTSVTTQERYLRDGTILRDNSITNRSTSSISIKPSALNSNITKTVSLPCANGASIRIIGYLKADTNFYNGGGSNWNAPTVVISGLSIAPVTYTASSAANNAFEKFDLTATNGSGADGNLTLTYTVNAKSVTTGTVYIDGIPDSPFVTKARHYGFTFDETNPERTVNGTTSASEAAASAYSGITVTWGASISTTALGADKTFQVLYDYTQYQSVLPANLPNAIPLAGVGLAGAPSLFAAGNVTTTGFTLNGSGSLSMGSFTLAASIPWVYTYTGGTFSQTTTIPTINGGTLNIGDAGTFTFVMAGSTIVSMTPAAPGTYNMGSSSFTGTLDLRNAAAHAITVQVPTGTTYTTASNVGGVITVTTPAIYQSVALSGLMVGSRVQIYDTTSSTQLANAVVGATTYTWTDSVAASATRAIRLRVAYMSGVTAKAFIEANIGTCGTSSGNAGISYLVSQVADTTYNTNAIDGSGVAGITIAPSPARVSINIGGGAVTWPQIYAYQVYWLSTSTGISDEAAFITAPDTANYLLANFSIKNTNANPLTITGGYGRDATTGLVKDCIDTVGSTGNIFPSPDHAIPYSTGSGLTAGQDASLSAAASSAASAATGVTNITAGTTIVSANIKKVNSITVNGSGTGSAPWGP